MTMIQTIRLVLRELTPVDAAAMCRLNADCEMKRDPPCQRITPTTRSVSG
jgi:hypothetical protein